MSMNPCMSNGESSKRLLIFLKLLKNLGEQVKNIFAEQVIRDFTMNLLMRSDSEIQKICVEILCDYYGLKSNSQMDWSYDRS